MHKVIRVYFWVVLPLLAVVLIPYVFCSLYFSIKFNREKNIHPWSRTQSLLKKVYPGETLLYTLPDNRQYAEITLHDEDGASLLPNETNGLEIYTYGSTPRPTSTNPITVKYVERLEKNSSISVYRRCHSSYLIVGSEIRGSLDANESSECMQRLEIMDSVNYLKMSYNVNYTTIVVWTEDENSSDIYEANISETYFFCAVAECANNESVSFGYNFTTVSLTYNTNAHLDRCTTSCKIKSLIEREYLTVTNTNTDPSNGTMTRPTIHISYGTTHKIVIPLLIWLTPVYIMIIVLVIIAIFWLCIFKEDSGDENFDFYDILDKATEKSNFLRKTRSGNYTAVDGDDNGQCSSDTEEEDIVSYYAYNGKSGNSNSGNTSTEKTKLLL